MLTCENGFTPAHTNGNTKKTVKCKATITQTTALAIPIANTTKKWKKNRKSKAMEAKKTRIRRVEKCKLNQSQKAA